MPGEIATNQDGPSLGDRFLPTTDQLGVEIGEVDAKAVAAEWFNTFSKYVEAKDISGITSLLLDYALWRDILALTWDHRTFEGSSLITQFLNESLLDAGLSALQLQEDQIKFERLAPDLAWVTGMFSFETSFGIGTGVFRIVPTSADPSSWKAYTLFTLLEEIKGHPERLGPLRNPAPDHGMWIDKRRRELNFEDRDPAVVIIGSGHTGLEIAARLKVLGIPALVLEKNKRVGDNWRGRYESLCLHNPVWADHFPYIPFPPSWPIWTPAPKLANWLESYAEAMELNVWNGSTIISLKQNDPIPERPQTWSIEVKREDDSSRILQPRHVVFAHGWGGGVPKVPTFPGMEKFQGKMIHSSQYKTAREHLGKKVVVIGACTSGHDVAHDHCDNGIDVTMYQRSSTHVLSTEKGLAMIFKGYFEEGAPPTEIADRLFHSIPNHAMRLLQRRLMIEVAKGDSAILEGLQKRGFRTDHNWDGSGALLKMYERAGGYYIDIGASQLIAEGKIKLKNDSAISHFSEHGIEFEDGSSLPADVIIFATGYGDIKDLVHELAGPSIGNAYGRVWGLDDEGEINNSWRSTGVPGLYHMTGCLTISRFHSKALALLIQAQELRLPVPIPRSGTSAETKNRAQVDAI